MKNLTYLLFFVVCGACSDEFLELKPNKSLVVPTTYSDLEALLNHTGVMNTAPAIGILGGDDFFTTDIGWSEWTNPIERYGYTWEADVYQGQQTCSDWNAPYQQIFYSNVVLDALKKLTPANEEEQTRYETIQARALFHRGFALYQAAQLFCSPYSEATLDAPGLPIRLTSLVSTAITRATISETYAQILADLTTAQDLLPLTVAAPTQPTRATGKALLAMVYLSMREYEEAEQFASEALALNNTLMDYNVLTPSSTRPVARFNGEVLFHASCISYKFTTSTMSYVDTLLYARYSDDDLRKTVFFRKRDTNRYTYKGNYTGTSSLFGGISTNEVLLVRAECKARSGAVAEALADLNLLLEKRYKTGTFVAETESDPQALLEIILNERQKELVFRPARWMDLRRLNQEEGKEKELKRKLNGNEYTLLPNSLRYVYPLPLQEINNSGIAQNPR